MSDLTEMADNLEAQVEVEKSKIKAREEAKRRVAEESRPAPPSLVAFSAKQLKTHRFPQRDAFITRDGAIVIAAGHIAEVVANRGTGKTWVLVSLGLMAANGGATMGFASPRPLNVLYIDGEMESNDIKERIALLSDKLHLPLTDNFKFIAADWQAEYLPRLDTPEGQAAIEAFVEWADLIIFDNRSTLCDPEGEKDPSAWQPMGDYLLSLRKRGKAVVLAHHTNRQGGARGIGKPEDTMNVLVKLTRPEGYTSDQGARFVWEFDKARGLYGPAAAPFSAALTQKGWEVDAIHNSKPSLTARILDYLRNAETAGVIVKSANTALSAAKVSRNDGLKAWNEMLADGRILGDAKTGYKAAAVPF